MLAGCFLLASLCGNSQESPKPKTFPHRVWAACDFEGQTLDYGWFGVPETNAIPKYHGNKTALRAPKGPYQNISAIMAGINPVPGPRMGKENWLFLRYNLAGGTRAIVQHFSLSTEDNWHVNLIGLQRNAWAELAVNFTAHASRNDGSNKGFGEGERMDDFKMFAGEPGDPANYKLLIDDVIFFSYDPSVPPEPEPFPNRIIFLAGFDTGEKEKYWPGDFQLIENPPAGAYWRAARAIPKIGVGEVVRVQIAPPRPVGNRTKLRFRYHLVGSSEMTVQIFDATVQDNRHILLRDLAQGEWRTQYVDFTRDNKRNDGTPDNAFAPGSFVDDLFFFVKAGANLHIDEVTLFDAAEFNVPKKQ
jgi:hypothetical protein